MLAFDDVQHIPLTRAPALTGRYEFPPFRSAAAGRAWPAAILDKVHSAEGVRASIDTDKRWATVAFTRNGLRLPGVTEPSPVSFPGEFHQGIVARAQILGDTGANHFGYRDRSSQPVIKGSDDEPTVTGRWATICKVSPKEIVDTIAARSLNGESPQDMPIVRGANAYMFDSGALRSWRVQRKRAAARQHGPVPSADFVAAHQIEMGSCGCHRGLPKRPCLVRPAEAEERPATSARRHVDSCTGARAESHCVGNP